ncbi:MAG TPA: YggS family pyridoxal phosphate-dependent enzyme [Chitinophagaceae bacterium]|jgi:pyridoxal phosphate enzyme (YggS family)|nr:YggS family pyridoxal phosphate-dependent enzyme [Chitinophagaceae bacterium]HNA95613.1 YggS family pyridoxal phosphate-dependent enzyme [Chitinophagaceae bacterium]HNC37859.1 YggS family pyridoxal phosphate-dependent enzyme [Chitinophagaceae bacterium]HND96097.1 YggS family pyridoxal phosphate-dependent enzyme [Chitinophagaceae bacterium]HNF37663.1 YggS family pyridoxal phosphate-dependent enzyme [Chitinophagaceae bacterium]
MNDIVSNIHSIRKRILNACKNANRNPLEVKLLLATKTVTAQNIAIALHAGETLIGENKIQELKDKFETLKSIPHQSHFIGHLQSNKIKEVIKYADCIQSVDRLSLAEKLQKRLEYENKSIDIFLQFNTSNEESKFGMQPEHAIAFAQQVKKLDRLNIKGLMTIGLFSAETEKVRKCFRILKNIQTELLETGIAATELSMGMSGDLEIAIKEGATIIRVGTAIFGKRPFPDSYYWNEQRK